MKEIGQFFKDRLDQATPDVPDQLWNKIHKSSELQKFNRLSRLKRGMLYYATPFLAVTLVAFVVWQVTSQKNTDSNSILVSNTKIEKVTSQPKEVATVTTNTQETNSPISEKATNAKDEIISNSKSVESVKPQNTTPSKTFIITNSNVAVPQMVQISDNTNQSPSHSQINKNQTIQTIDANPNNVSNNVIDQIEPDKVSNSNTNPDAGKQLFIPKGFTPNSDGTNDQFLVIADWEVDNFEILIFNRGGGLIFKSADIHQGWDGTYNNGDAPQGVYVYKIQYKNQNGDDKILKGSLTLIR